MPEEPKALCLARPWSPISDDALRRLHAASFSIENTRGLCLLLALTNLTLSKTDICLSPATPARCLLPRLRLLNVARLQLLAKRTLGPFELSRDFQTYVHTRLTELSYFPVVSYFSIFGDVKQIGLGFSSVFPSKMGKSRNYTETHSFNLNHELVSLEFRNSQ